MIDITTYAILRKKMDEAIKKAIEDLDPEGGYILYDTYGQNTDGAITQKGVTDLLQENVEFDVDEPNETLSLVLKDYK